MTVLQKLTVPAALAAALAFGVSHPAQAQEHITRTRTVITHYTFTHPMTAGQRESQRLHRLAVRLDHQATYADQHGNPKLGESLARQASQVNAQAYRAALH